MEKEYLRAHYTMLAGLLEKAHKTCLKVLKGSDKDMANHTNIRALEEYPLVVEIEGYHYTADFKNDDPDVKFSIKLVGCKKDKKK